MYLYPEKKKTLFTIPTKFWDFSYLLEQQNVETTNDYFELFKISKSNDLVEVFRVYLKRRKFLWKILCESEVAPRRKVRNRAKKILIYRNLHLYEKQLWNILFPIRKSIYTWKPKASNNKNKRPVFSSGDEVIAKMTWVNINNLDTEFTLEQRMWWNDKATYDYYEWFKQGERVNSLVRWQMPLSDEENDLVQMVKKDRGDI